MQQGPSTTQGTRDDVLHRLARHAARAVPAEQAFVVLREPAAPGTMRVAAVAGADPALVGRRFRVGEGLAGRVVTSGRALVAGGDRRFAPRIEPWAGSRLHAAAAAPVRVRDAVQGAVVVATSDARRRFADDDLELLDEIAGLVGGVLEAVGSAVARRERKSAAAPRGSRPRADAQHVLPAALDRLEHPPALAESRDRLLAVLKPERPAHSEIVNALESDIGLVVSVLRLANQVGRGKRGGIVSVPEAVEALTSAGVKLLAERVPVVDFFAKGSGARGGAVLERLRTHAVAVQRAAERLAAEIDYPWRDDLAVSALLHDVGKLVLADAYAERADAWRPDTAPPDERATAERNELGFDHALVGGVLLRRWGLPDRLAAAVERHHSEDADGEAAIVRLADMLAHHAHGRPVDPGQLLRAARAVGLGPDQLRSVLYELPAGGGSRRTTEPSPLTPKELQALRGLAEGKLYKEIAASVGVSTSTIRSHLHSSYKKLGAADRAQAVLIATERGWL